MKQITKTVGFIIVNCALVTALFSCNGSTSDNYTRCEDSLAMYTKPAAIDTTTKTNDSATADKTNTESGEASYRSDKEHKKIHIENNATRENEPTGAGTLVVTSSAFTNMGVIPVKYTCDGQGATPPLKVTNIPAGSQSLAIIVYDYNATPEGGMTFWIIWNIDTYGNIPEDYRNSHETMNKAGQYGNTPLCGQYGDHKYHFIVYALDTKLVIGKNTTKKSIENVMRGHILAKGELVGVYNKHLE